MKFVLRILTVTLFLLLFNNLSFPQNFTQYVNPFIGTGGHGHTFPGASMPFGMVQLSPDTGIEGWDWCSGYHDSDSSIIGFSHTHLSGTGASDYGDILFMPFSGEIKLIAGSKDNPDEGYRQRFSHSNEKAVPGYYSVLLKDDNILAELTATNRVGFHRYTFNNKGEQKVLIDLLHGISDRAVDTYIEKLDDHTLIGHRISSGWAKEQHVYFVAKFNSQIKNLSLFNEDKSVDANSAEGKSVKAVIEFESNEPLLVKVALSSVSTDGAVKNLNSELPDWDFDLVKNNADEAWNNELSKISIEDDNLNNKTVFYTALYHSMLVPNIYNDVDHKYRGMDMKIHVADGYDHYTVYSLWDTFRAEHPLFTIIDKKRTRDFIRSMYSIYQQAGILPVWELASNETWTMIGYHSIPVIVDAMMKGIITENLDQLFEAMKSSAMEDHHGLVYYKKMGFVPLDKDGNAVSKTLEYAYDDWCIAIAAKFLGKEKDYKYFMQRAQNYKNVFDPETKFMRGRRFSGKWRENFDPLVASGLGAGEFTEGNSWQYTWFVPQDINSLAELMGGEQAFENKLDELFKAQLKEGYHRPADMSGLIGQYAHGNEPSHHIAYLYSYIGKPYKSQEKLWQILNEMYTVKNDGLIGNEDCGQMSAWYVLSSLGFYPVLPGSNEYLFGIPLFGKVSVKLENGKTFTIVNDGKGKYIQSIELNGTEYSKSFFDHSVIENGGTFVIKTSNSANKEFGKLKADRPVSEINEKFIPVEDKYIFAPAANSAQSLFTNKIEVKLSTETPDAVIYCTLDGSDPNMTSAVYNSPITIDHSTTVKAIAYREDLGSSDTFERKYSQSIYYSTENPFYEKDGIIYPLLKLENKYEIKYSGGGDNALLDGTIASMDFADGRWQGYEGKDLIAVIDLGKPTAIDNIFTRFYGNHGSWIFYPEYVKFLISSDGKNFEEIDKIKLGNEQHYASPEIKTVGHNFNGKEIQFVKLIAKSVENCPAWHSAAGGKAWIFSDEIIIESAE